MNSKKIPAPVLTTIFGAKGDLTRRKLIPALYNLYIGNHLPAKFAIFCVDYLATDIRAFKDDLLAGVNEFSRNGSTEKKKWLAFAAKLFNIQGDFQETGTFSDLKKTAADFDKQNGKRSTRVFYF